jgi:hypothetical protein
VGSRCVVRSKVPRRRKMPPLAESPRDDFKN